jgi:hypothetical protein
MIYSKSHPNKPIMYQVRFDEPKFFDLSIVPETIDVCAKLRAIGIDPKFIGFETLGIDFDYEAELNELMIDYELFFPEDKA